MDIADFYSQHKKATFLGLALIILFSLLLFFSMRGSGKKEISDVVKVESHFLEFQASASSSEALKKLKPLSSIIKDKPSLQAKYAGPIAQVLLAWGLEKEAQYFLEKAFSEAKKLGFEKSSFYAVSQAVLQEKALESLPSKDLENFPWLAFSYYTHQTCFSKENWEKAGDLIQKRPWIQRDLDSLFEAYSLSFGSYVKTKLKP